MMFWLFVLWIIMTGSIWFDWKLAAITMVMKCRIYKLNFHAWPQFGTDPGLVNFHVPIRSHNFCFKKSKTFIIIEWRADYLQVIYLAGFLATHNVTLSFLVDGDILRKSIRNEALIAWSLLLKLCTDLLYCATLFASWLKKSITLLLDICYL